MKILVTGGSGFLGLRLVSRLAEENKVTVFSDYGSFGKGVELITGDIRDKVSLRKAFFDADIVYHLAACLDESNPDMRDINVKGTQNVAELCKESKVKQLIFMSTTSVVGETKAPASETMQYNPETGYEKSKMEAEKIVKNSGIPYTVIRAPIILGPNQVWAAILGAAKRGYPIIGSGKNYFHLVYIDDAVDLLLLVKNNKKAINEVFHVAAKDANTYEDVYRMMAEELGVGMTEKHVPEWMAIMKARLHEFRRSSSKKRPELTSMTTSIKRLTRNRIISAKKAKSLLGFEARHSTREGLKETIKYLQISRLGYSDSDIADISRMKNDKEVYK
jgi:nucleoside-diphosphate-sugar epimerase